MLRVHARIPFEGREQTWTLGSQKNSHPKKSANFCEPQKLQEGFWEYLHSLSWKNPSGSAVRRNKHVSLWTNHKQKQQYPLLETLGSLRKSQLWPPQCPQTYKFAIVNIESQWNQQEIWGAMMIDNVLRNETQNVTGHWKGTMQWIASDCPRCAKTNIFQRIITYI